MATNMQEATRNTAAANRARVAASKNAAMPATNDDVMAQVAAMQAQMAQMMALVQQKDAQIAELKKAAPVKKEKPAPAPENMSITVSGSTLTIKVDLSKDTGKDTANGANRIIAQQNSAVGPYKFEHAGKEHWLSCCVAYAHPNAKELRAAYKASKKQQ